MSQPTPVQVTSLQLTWSNAFGITLKLMVAYFVWALIFSAVLALFFGLIMGCLSVLGIGMMDAMMQNAL